MGKLALADYKKNIYSAIVQQDNSIHLYINGQEIKTLFNFSHPIKQLRFFISDDNEFCWLNILDGEYLYQFDINTMSFRNKFEERVTTFDMTQFNGNSYSVIARDHKDLYIFEKKTQVLFRLPHGSKNTRLIVDHSGVYVAIHNVQDNFVYLYRNGDQVFKSQSPVIDFDYFVKNSKHYFLLHNSDQTFSYVKVNSYTDHFHFAVQSITAISNKEFFDFALLTDDNKLEFFKSCYKVTETPVDEPYDYQSLIEPQIALHEKLGAGSYGTVFLATQQSKQVAIKRYSGDPEYAFEEASSEISFLSRFRHSNIIHLYSQLGSQTCKVQLSMEYASKGNLSNYLSKLPSNNVWTQTYNKMAMQIASALSYLHSHRMALRDLKSGNIVVTENEDIKLIDFGFAEQIPEGKDFIVPYDSGTIPYSGPELFGKPRKLYLGSDIFSFGCILYEMGRHLHPWAYYETDQIINLLKQGLRKNPMPYTPPEVYQVIMACYSHDPLKRPSAESLTVTFGTLLQQPIIVPKDANKPYISTINIHDYEQHQSLNPLSDKCLAPNLPQNTLPPALPPAVSILKYGSLIKPINPIPKPSLLNYKIGELPPHVEGQDALQRPSILKPKRIVRDKRIEPVKRESSYPYFLRNRDANGRVIPSKRRKLDPDEKFIPSEPKRIQFN